MGLEFGKIMRDIREKNGWSLSEMADRLGTTKQALSKYERGERTPKITAAARFADVLGIPLETLIGYEYHEEEPAVHDEFNDYIDYLDRNGALDLFDIYMELNEEHRKDAKKYMLFLRSQEQNDG